MKLDPEDAPAAERVSERPVRTPLRRFLLEGVVIVASILLAFAIDAWWNDLREAEEEARILEAVAQEFHSVSDLTEAGRDYQRARVERIDRLLAQVGPEVRIEDPEAFWSDLSGVIKTGAPLLSVGAIDGVFESGGLLLLDDVELRTRLAAWRTYRQYYESIVGFIEDYTDTFNAYLISKGVGGALPELAPNGSAFPIAPELLARDPVFESQLVYLRSLANHWVQETDELESFTGEHAAFVESLRRTQSRRRR